MTILNQKENHKPILAFILGFGLLLGLGGCDGPQSIVLPDDPPAQTVQQDRKDAPIWSEPSREPDENLGDLSKSQSSLAPPANVRQAPYIETESDLYDTQGPPKAKPPLPLNSLMKKGESLSDTQYGDYPLWSSNRRYKASENAHYHYKKHGQDLGVKSYEDFVALTHGFIHTPPKGTETIMRSNGDKLYYNSELNIFAVATKKGAPRTLFRPDNGPSYWAKQKQIESQRRTIRNDQGA